MSMSSESADMKPHVNDRLFGINVSRMNVCIRNVYKLALFSRLGVLETVL